MKSKRIELAIVNKIRFILVIPHHSNTDRYPLYCIEYFHQGKQTKTKEGVKLLYHQYLNLVKDVKSLHEKLSILRTTFEDKVNSLLGTIHSSYSLSEQKITMHISALEAFKRFLAYHKQRFELGEIRSYCNFKERDKKVVAFIKAYQAEMLLTDLNPNVWINYRSYLKDWGLANSTINLQMVYIKGFYIWLNKLNEIPIHDHTVRLRKLGITHQQPKYNEIEPALFEEFFKVVSANDKHLRLHLISRLVAENTLRPVQVRKIQVKHISLKDNIISIFDCKGKKWRKIIISKTVKSLIQEIYANTIEARGIIDKEDYLLGFENQTKQGKSYTQSMFRERIVMPFKKEHPQFTDLMVYDFKHTSITRAFKVNSVYEVQKRAGHSKVTTTQIYDRSADISRPITVEELIAIK